jgi:hypothetical protein
VRLRSKPLLHFSFDGFSPSFRLLAPDARAKNRASRRTPNEASPAILWSAGACPRFLRPYVLPYQYPVGALLAAPAMARPIMRESAVAIQARAAFLF